MTATRTATDRQIAYLRSLVRQIIDGAQTVGLDPSWVHNVLADWTNGDLTNIDVTADLSTREASAKIEQAKGYVEYLRAKRAATPTAPAPTAAATVEPGFYLFDNVVYRVVPNRDKTRTYAKSLNFATGQWLYSPGVVGRLSATDALTEVQAASLGHQYGRCVLCGKELSDADSVARGIGPVCYARHLG